MSTRQNLQPPVPFSTTLAVRDGCLCFQTQRAARELARTFDRAFQPFNLSNGQFSLLMALNRPVPPAMGQLGDELGMDRTTVTAAVKVLSARGLLARRAAPDDRRIQHLALTPEGHALLHAVLPVWRETLARIHAAGAGAAPGAVEMLGTLARAAATAREGR